MAKKKEFSVEDKLRALYDLQLIDSRIDTIRSVRGELPLEVEDLEDEVAGLEVRLSKVNEEIDQCSEEIKAKQNTSEHARTMIKKYKDQQKNVRNNRAFESLSKEIEFQELEIELCEKQTKELKVKIELKKEIITQSTEKINERKIHLDHKKNDLEDILKETGMDYDRDHNKYPHEFSGGQRQRIAIARALILKPKILILDEPTSALDITIQNQILDLLQNLQEKYSLSYIFISHDMNVIRSVSDKIIVLNKGKLIEYDNAESIFNNPVDEYTKNLIRSVT